MYINKIQRKLIEKSLFAYLSAGTKEERQEASVIAKAAYKLITGNSYNNPTTPIKRKEVLYETEKI